MKLRDDRSVVLSGLIISVRKDFRIYTLLSLAAHRVIFLLCYSNDELPVPFAIVVAKDF